MDAPELEKYYYDYVSLSLLFGANLFVLICTNILCTMLIRTPHTVQLQIDILLTDSTVNHCGRYLRVLEIYHKYLGFREFAKYG